jgi:hypothetical protein
MGIISYISSLYSGNSNNGEHINQQHNDDNSKHQNTNYNIVCSSDGKSLKVNIDGKQYTISRVTNVIYKLLKHDDDNNSTPDDYYHIISYDNGYSAFLHNSRYDNKREDEDDDEDEIRYFKFHNELKLYINAKYEKTISLDCSSDVDVQIYNVYQASLIYLHNHKIELHL